VELIENGGTWSITSFTETNGQPRRAKCKKENWRTGLNVSDAYAHLNDVFERLPQ
jgi:hypothetical protein